MNAAQWSQWFRWIAREHVPATVSSLGATIAKFFFPTIFSFFLSFFFLFIPYSIYMTILPGLYERHTSPERFKIPDVDWAIVFSHWGERYLSIRPVGAAKESVRVMLKSRQSPEGRLTWYEADCTNDRVFRCWLA